MLLLYVFIILLVLLTLLSAFGGSIRAAPAASPVLKFEKFSANEQNEIEEFMASEPFRRGLYPPTSAPIMANVVSPGSYQSYQSSSDYPPIYRPTSEPPAPQMPSSISAPAQYNMPMQRYEMYEEKIEEAHNIEPFEENELQQASY
jgi:hypothetical protein